MKKYLLLFLLFDSLLFIVLLNNYYHQKVNRLVAENNALQEKLTKNAIPEVSLNDLFLFGQKTKNTSTVKAGNMYFTAEKKTTENQEVVVEIKLEGDPQALTDGAEIRLNFNNNSFEIKEIIAGNSFPLYPRKVIEQNVIIITGLSTIEKNNIIWGKPNTVFATLKVIPKQEGQTGIALQVNQGETKIYYQAQDILDRENSIFQIEI